MPSFDTDSLVAYLDACGDHRVLRRARLDDLPARLPDPHDIRYRCGLALDVETTGLDPAKDRIIELAMRPFWSDLDGMIVAVGEPVSCLEDPGRPLSETVIRLTGLTDADLAGRAIDAAAVAALLAQAQFVVAHNAAFDRPFMEARFAGFDQVPWLCSCHDVDWPTFGFDGRSLGWLLAQCGLFVADPAHRAGADVDAMLALLRHRLPDGAPALAHAYARSGEQSYRISAVGSPFATKDDLRSRGYRWSPHTRVWRREVRAEALDAERDWLLANIYAPHLGAMADEPEIQAVDWLSRYSLRGMA